MKTLRLVLAMMLMAGTAQAAAQVGALSSAEVIDRSASSDPAEITDLETGEWLAFRIPVQQGTHSPCCWKGPWDKQREVGCSLAETHQSYGTRSDSPVTESLVVYARQGSRQVDSIQLVGEHCPVDGAGARVHWLAEASDKASLDWLDSRADASHSDSVAGASLYAMALHRSPKAGNRLYKRALDMDDRRGDEAIFWLGEARGEAGLEALTHLLAKLPEGERRREINFALGVNGSAAAASLLSKISGEDPDPQQRAGALFWLADAFPEQAEQRIRQVLATEVNEDVVEQALFAASQLTGIAGTRLLLELVKDGDQPRHLRRQALFWLANSDDEQAAVELEQLLTR